MLKELDEDDSVTSPKRKRNHSKKKLLSDGKVKVRSLDDEILRSCQPTTVTASIDYNHSVKYGNSSSVDENPNLVKKSSNWSPVSKELVPEAKFNPDSIAAYLNKEEGRKRTSLAMEVRQHLLYMGWYMEFSDSKNQPRVRYHSPSGMCYYSLVQVCEELKESAAANEEEEDEDEDEDGDREEDGDGDGNRHEALSFEPIYCSKAMIDYYKISSMKGHGPAKEELRLKTRQHLAATGWSFSYRYRNAKREMIYISPQNKRYSSLRVVCQDCFYEGELQTNPNNGGNNSTCGDKRSRSSDRVRSSERVKPSPLQENPATPSARIFLEDGRSVLDCETQVFKDKARCLLKETTEFDASSVVENDSVCSSCHYGGDIILCDGCPASFHKTCLGLLDIPDGDWFCPSCCCRDCGQSKLNSTDSRVLKCGQCECKYHVECLMKRGKLDSGNLPTGNWYCSKKCKKISVGLSELIGKPIMVDGLTWTLLKLTNPNTSHTVKLSKAVDVMHECFETENDPNSKRDLIEDVIFSRESEINRRNFRGFYTVVLEKNKEMVAAANVRVYGDKVAELPLIGTRFKFRRLGMCRVLMNQLEKILKKLGVERLFLPSVPSVLQTWTTSFGFTEMTRHERLELLHHTFLDFQDTVKCHKTLLKGDNNEEESNQICMESSSESSQVLQAETAVERSKHRHRQA